MTQNELEYVNSLKAENIALKRSAEDARSDADGLRRKMDRIHADNIDAGLDAALLQ